MRPHALADGLRQEQGEREGQRGRWVGAAMARKEDPRMLRGSGRFTGDLTRTGMLHAAFVRSPFAAARVSAIGTSAALRAPGVAAAFTAADLGHPYLLATLEREEFVPTQMPLLAGDQVRFAGEPVAVVVAEGEATLVQYKGEANVRGTLARVGARVIQPAAKTITAQFFERMESQGLARSATASGT